MLPASVLFVCVLVTIIVSLSFRVGKKGSKKPYTAAAHLNTLLALA